MQHLQKATLTPFLFSFRYEDKSPPPTASELFDGDVVPLLIYASLTQKGTLRISNLSKPPQISTLATSSSADNNQNAPSFPITIDWRYPLPCATILSLKEFPHARWWTQNILLQPKNTPHGAYGTLPDWMQQNPSVHFRHHHQPLPWNLNWTRDAKQWWKPTQHQRDRMDTPSHAADREGEGEEEG